MSTSPTTTDAKPTDAERAAKKEARQAKRAEKKGEKGAGKEAGAGKRRARMEKLRESGVIPANQLERLEKQAGNLPPERLEKLKAVALVRDSFTMPMSDYEKLQQLDKRLIALQTPAQKTQIIRAGIHALAALDDAKLKAMLALAPAVKTGRPPKADKAA